MSSWSKPDRTLRSSGVFFHRGPARSGPTDALGQNSILDQLVPSPCHCVFIEAQQFRQFTIAAATTLHTLQTSEEPSLLLIQEAVEEHDCGSNLLLFILLHFRQSSPARLLLLTALPRWRGVKV